MSDKIVISLIQANIAWENPGHNLVNYSSVIDGLQESDIIILPEMFPTGFTMDVLNFHEFENGASVTWMREMAKKTDAAVCGSMIIKDGENYYNRLFFVTPEGEVFTYNKRHLFRMGEEHEHFTPGRDRVVFEYKGWRIMPQICYDLRFPVWFRNQNDYDLLINVANWPSPRKKVWNTLLSARAIENQCFIAAVNRIGKDAKGLDHSGDSMLVDFKGEIIQTCMDEEKTITVELIKKDLQKFKETFPTHLDADDFTLNP